MDMCVVEKYGSLRVSRVVAWHPSTCDAISCTQTNGSQHVGCTSRESGGGGLMDDGGGEVRVYSLECRRGRNSALRRPSQSSRTFDEAHMRCLRLSTNQLFHHSLLHSPGSRMFASGPSVSAARQCIRSFSTTRLCRSKVGGAPLSLPPEVKFNILAPTAVNAGKGVSKDEQGRTVEISGPLGTMKMNIPAYMSISENSENRTQTLSILDANDRKQREMWGE